MKLSLQELGKVSTAIDGKPLIAIPPPESVVLETVL